jgi:WD40 repeat protein
VREYCSGYLKTKDFTIDQFTDMQKTIIITLLLLGSTLFLIGQSKKRFIRIPTDESFIYDICYSKAGTVLFVADDNSIKAFDTKSQQLISEFSNGHTAQILSIDLSTDSSTLVSGAKDSTTVIWDMESKKPLKTIKLKGIVTSVDISHDGKLLAIGTSAGTAYLYNLDNLQQQNIFNDHFEDISAVAISPGNNLLATTGADKTVKLYDVKTGELISQLDEHKNWVRDIAFSPDSSKLISCGDDSRVIHWNITNPEKPKPYINTKTGSGWVLCVEYYNDSHTYAYGDFGGNVAIKSAFAEYTAKTKAPVTKVIFQPNDNGYFKLAVATRGKGVLLMKAGNMIFKGEKE